MKMSENINETTRNLNFRYISILTNLVCLTNLTNLTNLSNLTNLISVCVCVCVCVYVCVNVCIWGYMRLQTILLLSYFEKRAFFQYIQENVC